MIAEILKCEELAHVPIPLLSAKADEELKIQLLTEQAQDFVGKPFSEINLLVRVRNQIELSKSQEQHRTLSTAMDQGFCTIEVLFDECQRPIDYRFLEVNRAFEKQTGLTGVIGRRMRELGPHHEQHWFDICGTIALTGRPARFENRAEALNRWYEVCAFPVGASQHRHVAIFFNDITERKGMEAGLRDSKERLLALSGQLEQMVEERTEELVQSQDRSRAVATELNLAEQRERKRIAIELHDHLQQLLVLGKLKLGQGRQCESVPDCIEVMTETDAVLSEALRYTRTFVAELSPPVLLEHGLAAGLKWLGEQMREYQMTVTVECMSDELRLPEDYAVLLFRSVRELLINSAKHAESGRATVRMGQNHHRLHIEVQDLGKGFDPLVAAKPQATTPHSSKFGLFSIRERVKAVGGRFEIQSAPGQGTTVFLELPLTERGKPLQSLLSTESRLSPFPSESGVGPSAQQSKGLLQNIRVLLVDDHAMMRQGLRSVLEAYPDVEIVGEAQDGEQAVALVHDLRPAIVIMDINMPRLNGIEATVQIKSSCPETQVIGSSVNGEKENHEAMIQAGAARLITKDAVVDELYRAIQELMRTDSVRQKSRLYGGRSFVQFIVAPDVPRARTMPRAYPQPQFSAST